jgi:hypothetical protein
MLPKNYVRICLKGERNLEKLPFGLGDAESIIGTETSRKQNRCIGPSAGSCVFTVREPKGEGGQGMYHKTKESRKRMVSHPASLFGEVPGSNLCPEVGYYKFFPWFSSAPPGRYLESIARQVSALPLHEAARICPLFLHGMQVTAGLCLHAGRFTVLASVMRVSVAGTLNDKTSRYL